jgi:hypothetical protein
MAAVKGRTPIPYGRTDLLEAAGIQQLINSFTGTQFAELMLPVYSL